MEKFASKMAYFITGSTAAFIASLLLPPMSLDLTIGYIAAIFSCIYFNKVFND